MTIKVFLENSLSPEVQTSLIAALKHHHSEDLPPIFHDSDDYAQMPWLAVPFADQERIKSLKQRYRVIGTPHLVVVKSEDGNLVTTRGRKDIHEQGVKTIADWNKTVELNKEREQLRKIEEKEMEILYAKLVQIQLEKSAQAQL